jgi:hypothetical protein
MFGPWTKKKKPRFGAGLRTVWGRTGSLHYIGVGRVAAKIETGHLSSRFKTSQQGSKGASTLLLIGTQAERKNVTLFRQRLAQAFPKKFWTIAARKFAPRSATSRCGLAPSASKQK